MIMDSFFLLRRVKKSVKKTDNVGLDLFDAVKLHLCTLCYRTLFVHVLFLCTVKKQHIMSVKIKLESSFMLICFY